jgi:hypothetical protein
VAPEASYHWWDLRLHPTYGTIEVRAADVQTRIRDTATMIALVQSLAFSLAARFDAGERLTVLSSERIAENMWLRSNGSRNHLTRRSVRLSGPPRPQQPRLPLVSKGSQRSADGHTIARPARKADI